MSFTDLIKTVSSIAPVVGELLGGPAGGIVASMLANAFGGTAADPQKLSDLITADSDAKVKIAQIQSDLLLGMQQNAVQAQQNSNTDTQSARQYQVDMSRVTGKQTRMPLIIFCVTTILLAVALGATIYCVMSGVATDQMASLHMFDVFLFMGWLKSLEFQEGDVNTSGIKDMLLYASNPSTDIASQLLTKLL